MTFPIYYQAIIDVDQVLLAHQHHAPVSILEVLSFSPDIKLLFLGYFVFEFSQEIFVI
jgi:hypothetical protein